MDKVLVKFRQVWVCVPCYLYMIPDRDISNFVYPIFKSPFRGYQGIREIVVQEIAKVNPFMVFIPMLVFCPFPKLPKNKRAHFVEDVFGAYSLMVVCPSPDDRVKVFDKDMCRCPPVVLNDGLNLILERLHGFARWLYQQLAFILSDILR